jgi:hypothetical protein
MATEISLPTPDRAVTNKYLLCREISALKLLPTDNGTAVAGSLVHLPSGVELHGFGECFDARSLLVRFADSFYVVFQEDLDRAQMRSQAEGA